MITATHEAVRELGDARVMRLIQLLYSSHEVLCHAPVLVLLLQVSHVRTFLEDDPLRTLDAAMNRLGDRRGGLVVAAAGDERGQPDLAQTITNVPPLERTG